MDRNRQTLNAALLSVDVVTAMDPEQEPALALDRLGQFSPRNGLHTAMSTIRSCSPVSMPLMSTDRQPSTAS
jgi:hypothetical protein